MRKENIVEADILPPPLDTEEEGKMIACLGTEEDQKPALLI